MTNARDTYHVLATTSLVVPMPKVGFLREDATIWAILDRIEAAARDIVKEFGFDSECQTSSIGTVDGSKPKNAARCVICNVWVSAQNRPEIVQGLMSGAEYNGGYYCLEHLPDDSDWWSTVPWW